MNMQVDADYHESVLVKPLYAVPFVRYDMKRKGTALSSGREGEFILAVSVVSELQPWNQSM
jgi:hypothetical protein